MNQHQEIAIDFTGFQEVESASLKSLDLLNAQSWCQNIEKLYLAPGSNEIVSVYLSKIIPSSDSIHPYIWIIEGVLPTGFLNAQQITTPSQALGTYIGETEKWIDASRNQQDTSNLIPLSVSAPNFEAFETTLNIIKKRIYPGWI